MFRMESRVQLELNEMNRLIGKLSLFLSVLVVNQGANALCLDGHPSLANEFKNSDLVFIGKVMSESAIKDSDDPIGVKRYDYLVQIEKFIKGAQGRKIIISSENTSSRFPMTVGKKYFLLVSRASQNFLVDACGNSFVIDGSLSQ